ncbi:methyltransferase domain-containing protein [Microbispora rosea]|uniref:methyltransferase domain-containing protein n=1 Tax=Microbispora rosea TaxID=58117 RepID=UPI00378C61C5
MIDNTRPAPPGTEPEWLRPLLKPDVPARVSSAGYLDVLPDHDVAAPNRSQSLWLSGLGPRIYLSLVQPLVRLVGAPPGPGALASGLRLAPGASVLDVGCGPGVITAGLAEAAGREGRAVGLDVSAPMLRQAAAVARPNTGLVRGDAQDLPFRDAVFDAVCSTAMIMILPDPSAALTDMARVLRPGGRIAIVVPCRGGGLVGTIGAYAGRFAGGHMFGPDEVAALLEPLGFDLIRSHANDMISTTYARKADA